MILSSPNRIVSSGLLYMPGDLTIVSELIVVSISCLKTGSCGSLFSLMTFSTAVSPVTVWLYSSMQYSHIHLYQLMEFPS